MPFRAPLHVLNVKRLVAACVLIGLSVAATDLYRYVIPHHPGSTGIMTTRFDTQRGYCSNGNWVFPAGQLVTLVYVENVDANPADVRRWFEAAAFRTVNVRGVQLLVPRFAARSAHLWWPNIDIEPEAVIGNRGDRDRSFVQYRYRLHLCPPAIFLPR